jgi:hypothetical protein
LGLVGAPLGALLGVCVISLPGNMTALARAQAAPGGALLKSLLPWAWRFALLVLAAAFLTREFAPAGFPALAATGAVTLLVYLAVMLPVVLRDPLGAYVRPRLAPLARRFRGVGRDSGEPGSAVADKDLEPSEPAATAVLLNETPLP